MTHRGIQCLHSLPKLFVADQVVSISIKLFEDIEKLLMGGRDFIPPFHTQNYLSKLCQVNVSIIILIIRLKDSLCSLFRLSQVSQVSTGFDERLQLLSKLMFTSLEMSPLLFLSILRKRERIISLCLL